MKIIKRGILPDEKDFRGTCSVCGTIAEAKQKELKVRSDQRDGDTASATCPICKNTMHFYPLNKSPSPYYYDR